MLSPLLPKFLGSERITGPLEHLSRLGSRLQVEPRVLEKAFGNIKNLGPEGLPVIDFLATALEAAATARSGYVNRLGDNEIRTKRADSRESTQFTSDQTTPEELKAAQAHAADTLRRAAELVTKAARNQLDPSDWK